MYGEDYGTPDGTCVRDYIHVFDLCSAHDLAIDWLIRRNDSEDFNLGNGSGFSVRKVIEVAKEITGINFRVEQAEKRSGDPAVLVADSARARDVLGWIPKYPQLSEIMKHAWGLKQKVISR